MSIIQEALKKVQSDIKTDESQHEDAKPFKPADVTLKIKPAPVKPAKMPVIRGKTMIAVAVLSIVVLTLVAIGVFLRSSGKSPVKPRSESAQRVSYKPVVRDDAGTDGSVSDKAQPNTPVVATLPVRDLNLNLSGIMYLAERPRAIINDFIVGPGDIVEGAKVVEINPQSVILERDDVEMTLSLK